MMTRRAQPLRAANASATIPRYPPNRGRWRAWMPPRSVVKLGLFAARRSLEHEPVRVVEEPIADGVGQRRLADVVMPLPGRQLARHDGGARPVAVFEDLEQITPLLI